MPRKLLKNARMRLEDIDLFELNEAFASVVLRYVQAFDIDRDRLNVNGGALALGHPIGASGARLIVTLLHALHARGGKRGPARLDSGSFARDKAS